MEDAFSSTDKHAIPEISRTGTARTLSPEELLRLYENERTARIAAENRLEAACRERRTAKQSAAVRDYVMASAHCLLWYADIQETDKQYLWWTMEFPNADAARRFLPIEIHENETIQDAWYDRRHPEDRDACDILGTAAVRAGESYQQEFRCTCEDGSVRWVHEDVRVETVIAGRQWRAVGVCTDISVHRQIQARMQATNKRLKRSMTETHHRVKNNLQVVASLVEMQHNQEDQPLAVQTAFQRMGQHIRALAAMHDLLTQEAKSGGDLDNVSASAVLERLVALVRQTLTGRAIHTDFEDVRLPARQMTALVVLVNELVSNAVKHSSAKVLLSLTLRNGFYHLGVADDGPGFPEGFDPLTSGNTGMEIIESIGRLDLQGALKYANRPEGGANVSLEFPAVRLLLG